MDIPYGATLSNNDEVAKESRNYGVPHHVEEPTNIRVDVGRDIH